MTCQMISRVGIYSAALSPATVSYTSLVQLLINQTNHPLCVPQRSDSRCHSTRGPEGYVVLAPTSCGISQLLCTLPRHGEGHQSQPELGSARLEIDTIYSLVWQRWRFLPGSPCRRSLNRGVEIEPARQSGIHFGRIGYPSKACRQKDATSCHERS